jgi:hypothetical protein
MSWFGTTRVDPDAQPEGIDRPVLGLEGPKPFNSRYWATVNRGTDPDEDAEQDVPWWRR